MTQHKANKAVTGLFLFIFSVVLFAAPSLSIAESVPRVDSQESTQTDASSPLFFAVKPASDDEKMAIKALGAILANAQNEVGRHIPIALARHDLNDDGVKELFVRMLDPDYFCDQEVCQVYGFAVTNDGFIKIADFKTRTIDVLDTKTEGTRDLKLSLSPETQKTMRWNGEIYE